MSDAGGYEEYAFVADLYDHVVPYHERPDVAFFVWNREGRYWRSDVAPGAS
jgi:hypothetical protein